MCTYVVYRTSISCFRGNGKVKVEVEFGMKLRKGGRANACRLRIDSSMADERGGDAILLKGERGKDST